MHRQLNEASRQIFVQQQFLTGAVRSQYADAHPLKNGWQILRFRRRLFRE